MRAWALRDRLAVSFALALVIAYALIALCAVIIVKGTVARAIDGRLSTVAQAIYTIAGDERDEIDRKDRLQFAGIVTDASGALVLATDGSLLLGTTADVPAWARAAIRDEPLGFIFTTTADGHTLRAVVQRRQSRHATNTIVVWQSMRIVEDVEGVVVLVLSGFALVVALAGYAVGRQIAVRGLLPLTRITAIVADIAAHDLSRRVGPQPHADELGRLAATFDRMLDRLQEAFERQRQFTADASHDLRAPLATLRAEVELALRRDRTAAEYRAALIEIGADADQLDRLIDALLAAARTDGGDVNLRPLDLGNLIGSAVNDMEAFARSKDVAIEATIARGRIVSADDDLLSRAILAALHNAVKYTLPGGTIHIDIGQANGTIWLTIRDGGPGFTEAALTHAFDRFWRDDTARGRGGTGLGLAIAQAIVQRCGGSIAIDNPDGGGGRVVMTFPNASPVADPILAG